MVNTHNLLSPLKSYIYICQSSALPNDGDEEIRASAVVHLALPWWCEPDVRNSRWFHKAVLYPNTKLNYVCFFIAQGQTHFLINQTDLCQNVPDRCSFEEMCLGTCFPVPVLCGGLERCVKVLLKQTIKQILS